MARAPDSILNDDIPIDRIRWALPRRFFFAEEAGVLQKTMTLGHSHASMAATLAYWVFKGCPLRRGGGEQRSANQGDNSFKASVVANGV